MSDLCTCRMNGKIAWIGERIIVWIRCDQLNLSWDLPDEEWFGCGRSIVVERILTKLEVNLYY
jgi:hypothetical protein